MTDWEIVFLASEQPYVFTFHGLQIKQGTAGPGQRTVKIRGTTGANGLRATLQLGSAPDNTTYNPNYNVSQAGRWLISTAGAGGSEGRDYLARFELENLILDGNFSGEGALTGAGNTAGYKSIGVEVYARTGRIKDVLVRGFGANGELPWSYFQGAGSETFPVSVRTKAEDKVSGDWNLAANQYPWVIENVEVTDFRTLHGGYGTLIMPHVENTGASPTTWTDPIIAVRRCQVRGQGSAIALGTAGFTVGTTAVKSQRLLFEDNVVLNCGNVMNTDTGAIGWLTAKRNAFLDCVTGAYLGRWNEPVSSSPAAHDSYRFQQNLFRLRGRLNERDYHDFDESATGVLATDPNLALGRLFPKQSAALIIQGRATRITFEDNWLTTWPAADFFFPSPGSMPPAEYRVVWTPPPLLKSDARNGYRERLPASDVSFQNCRLSTEAFVFLPGAGSPTLPNGITLTGNGKLASTAAYVDPTPGDAPYTDNGGNNYYGSAYSAGYQDLRTPLSTASFLPKGKVERVRLMPDAAGHLERVREIVLGDCTLSGNQVTVQARVLDDWLPGTAAPGTVPSPSADVAGNVYVRADLYADGQWVALDGQNQAATGSPNASGVVQQTVTLIPAAGSLPAHGLVRVRAWINDPADAASALPGLDENADAWSSRELARGAVLTLDALPDVGDDKNTASGKRAKFILTRSGDLTAALTARLRLRGHFLDDGITPDVRLIKPQSQKVMDDSVALGNQFTVAGDVGGLPVQECRLFVNNVHSVTLNMSCGTGLGVGSVLGSFTVISGTSVGGPLCPATDCAACTGRITQLVLQYNGPGTANVKVVSLPATPILATYGNSGTADYSLSGGGYTAGAQTLPYERDVTFSSGQATLTLEVAGRLDNLTENNVVSLQVLPDTVGAADYAVGLQDRADALIWDGPEYTLQELTGPYLSTVWDSQARAVNAGVVNSAGTWTVAPQSAGTATWANVYGQPETHGSLWTSSSGWPATDFGLTFRPYGISFRPTTASADRAKLVGSYGTQAWRILDDGTAGVQLPHFTGATASLAWGISPDAAKAVGYSILSGNKKPVVWVGTATPANLAQGLAATAVGEARAINNAGVIVGYSSGLGDSILRPFRSDGTNLDDQDDLPVPSGNGAGQANALTTVGSNHYAVGSYVDGNPQKRRGAYWKGNPLPSLAVSLDRLLRNTTLDAEAEALGINSSLKIVGWSGASESDYNRHAVLSDNGSAWVDLNDKHFTHGLGSSWTLQQANAISDTGVIVGVGTLSGSTRGFLLIPRVPGN